jgi:ubiquinone biosynthesis protein
MSLLDLPANIRSVKRLSQIVAVLSGYGFGGLVRQLNLGRFVPFRRRLGFPGGLDVDWDVSDPHWPARLAAAFKELGPTFIKLGQILSSRADLLPPAFIVELKKLQDKVPPSDPELVRRHLEAELGGPVEGHFRDFDWNPVGGGSIAQVHFAVTRDGERVVVKVRRPLIDKVMRADGQLLVALAGMLERHVPESRVYRPTVIAAEFVRNNEQELDFISEAANTARFHEAFKNNPHIVIPRIRWDLTTSGVLTMSRLAGRNISSTEALAEYGVDRPKVAEHLLDAFIEQYFRLGMFHGDPHPGNLMVLGPEKVALLDFGLVGHLSDDMRDRLVTALLAALERELGVVVEVFNEVGAISEDTDIEELKADAQKFIDKYTGLSLGRFALDRMFNEITDLCRRHHVVLPRDFVMIIKSLITIGGVGMTLDPDLDLAGLLRPRLKKVLLDRIDPRKLGKHFLISGWQWLNLVTDVPARVAELFRKTVRGHLTVKVRLAGFESSLRDLEGALHRQATGLIAAGGFIGSALMLAHRAPPTLVLGEQEFSVLGLGAFLVSAAAGLVLLRTHR